MNKAIEFNNKFYRPLYTPPEKRMGRPIDPDLLYRIRSLEQMKQDFPDKVSEDGKIVGIGPSYTSSMDEHAGEIIDVGACNTNVRGWVKYRGYIWSREFLDELIEVPFFSSKDIKRMKKL